MAAGGRSRSGRDTFPSLTLLRPRIHKARVCPLRQVFFSLWLTMQSFRAEKPKLQKSSKPPKKWTTRRNEIADTLESDEDNIAMVACSKCVKHNVVYYYDRRQSVQCAACLRHQRNCDSTFSLEEFRKVGV